MKSFADGANWSDWRREMDKGFQMTETIFVVLSFASDRVSSTTSHPDSLYTQKIALVSVYKYC